MKAVTAAFVAGIIFSLGLILGGMTIPNNIIEFLDLTGNWKPALAFVMIGAIAVYFIGFRLIIGRKKPILAAEFQVPQMTAITPGLMIGSAIFGIGWALSGFCPGPAIVSAGAGEKEAIVFTIFMLIGMQIYQSQIKGPKSDLEESAKPIRQKNPTT